VVDLQVHPRMEACRGTALTDFPVGLLVRGLP
jgi:hypothetical protein